MSTLLKNLQKTGNINCIKTSKYKEISIIIRFTFPYEEQKKANLAVISALLGESSQKHPTKQEMSIAKDLLYGIDVSAYPSTCANLQNFTIAFNFINPRFLKDIQEKDYIDFIDEILYKPNFTSDLVNEAIMNLKDAIVRNLDVPNAKAYENFLNIISLQDKRFKMYQSDICAYLDQVTLESVQNTYQDLFEQRKDIYIVGDYSKELVMHFEKLNQTIDYHSDIYPNSLMPIGEKKDEMDVAQSTLIVAFKTPFSRKSENYHAFNIANIMFGGIPSSLLFQEVREKNSLCYSIYAQTLRYEGLMLVNTQIDAKNKDKALQKIREQFKRMQEGDFDEELLQSAKTLLINNALSMEDDVEYFVDYLNKGEINNTYEPLESLVQKIEKVTLSDVKAIYKDYEEVLVYFLEGKKHE